MARVISVPARRLVAGICLALATLVVAILGGGPRPASASHDGYVDVGSMANTASSTTGVSTSVGNGLQGTSGDQSASGVYGENNQGGFGVAGRSQNSVLCGVQPCTGVRGEGEGSGVAGLGTAPGSTGVVGSGPAIGVLGDGMTDGSTGVHGTGTTGVRAIGEDTPGSTGVLATSDFGLGVRGYGGTTGVEAESPTTALRVIGKSTFSRSGRATIPQGSVSVNVTVDLDPGSMVLATLQQNRINTWIKSAVPKPVDDMITITLNQQAPESTRVAWFVIEMP